MFADASNLREAAALLLRYADAIEGDTVADSGRQAREIVITNGNAAAP
jgi:hypothetical protein